MKEMIMTLKLYSMPAAAAKLGYSLPFMNRICQRAFCSSRPFLVLKDENAKYFIEANSLQRYINTCPDFNPYEIPGVYEPDSEDEDAPMDDTVFMLDDDMLPQVCGVEIDEEWSTPNTLKNVYQHTFSDERKQVDKKIDEFFESAMEE